MSESETDVPVKRLSTWKRLALISFSGGAGFAAVVALIIGGIFWYSLRPVPPKLWNMTALQAREPPSFSPSEDGKKIELTYAVQNTTEMDYELESSSNIKVLAKTTDGSLSQPLPANAAELTTRVFIPARQKGSLEVALTFSSMPTKTSTESDEEFHEKLRTFLKKYDVIETFVLFDNNHRYQVNLPKWASARKNP